MTTKKKVTDTPPSLPLTEAELMWEAEDGHGVTAQCLYDSGRSQFTVVLKVKGEPSLTKTESFPQTYTPTFGMDLQDHHKSLEIAERLAGVIDIALDQSIN